MDSAGPFEDAFFGLKLWRVDLRQARDHAQRMVRRSGVAIPEDLRRQLEAARLDLLAL